MTIHFNHKTLPIDKKVYGVKNMIGTGLECRDKKHEHNKRCNTMVWELTTRENPFQSVEVLQDEYTIALITNQ